MVMIRRQNCEIDFSPALCELTNYSIRSCKNAPWLIQAQRIFRLEELAYFKDEAEYHFILW
jgi:hypothetical protein